MSCKMPMIWFESYFIDRKKQEEEEDEEEEDEENPIQFYEYTIN